MVEDLVNEVFGNKIIKTRQRCRSGERVTSYNNLGKIQQNAVSHTESLSRWQVIYKDEASTILTRLTSIYIHFARYGLEVKLNKNKGEIHLYGYHGCSANVDDLGMSTEMVTLLPVSTILSIINGYDLCTGLRETDDIMLNETERDSQYFLAQVKDASILTSKIISKPCKVIAMKDLSYCSSCSSLRKFLRRRYRRQQSTSGSLCVNTRYLDRSQLEQKIGQKCKEMKVAKEKSRFWENKFSNESLCLENGESTDLETIFGKLNDQCMSENIKLLIAQQKRPSKQKDQVGTDGIPVRCNFTNLSILKWVLN